jgi:hypothetical protein
LTFTKNLEIANRVSGGSTPIHDVLLGGANHRSDGLFRPNPDSKQGQDANNALEFHTASVSREPESTIRCWVDCSLRRTALCRVSHKDEDFSDLADSGTTTPITACISFLPLSTTRSFPNAVGDSISQVLRASTHPRRMFPSNSFGSLRT